MAINEKIFGEAPTTYIHFRNPHSIAPVIIQMFMVFSAFLIILGLAYVIVLVIAITIHHYLYDSDPESVPDFVKRSIQFSSSDDSGDDDGQGYVTEEASMQGMSMQQAKSAKTMRKPSKSRLAAAESNRKAENLEKFLYNEDRA